jgi:phosphoribosylanthranilate isomerase
MRTRVKICGITRVEDGLAAIAAGADAIGLVFYPPSPRAVTPELAREILAKLPPFVTSTGLFVDHSREQIEAILELVPLDLLQFHGHETPEQCAGHGRPWIKALRMHDGIDLHRERGRYSSAAGLLLDAYRKGVPGGTGESFDWGRIPADLAGEVTLAGGLDPDNIEQAIESTHPYAVDVSGGVEAAKGIKSALKIESFMKGVQRADRR